MYMDSKYVWMVTGDAMHRICTIEEFYARKIVVTNKEEK